MSDELTYRTIEPTPLTVCIGAEVCGVRVLAQMSGEAEAEVKDGLLCHCVLFFSSHLALSGHYLTHRLLRWRAAETSRPIHARTTTLAAKAPRLVVGAPA